MNEREKFQRMRRRIGRGWLAINLDLAGRANKKQTAEHAEHAEQRNSTGTGRGKSEAQQQPSTGDTHDET